MASLAQTVAGTQFAASAASPATYNAAGFAALTFTDGDTCEIVNIGDIGMEWNTSESNTICTDPIITKKSRAKMIPFMLTLNFVKGDTLQEMLSTAFASKTAVLSLEITDPNGTDKQWCTAQVSKLPKKFGGGEDFITTEVEFLPQGEWVYSV